MSMKRVVSAAVVAAGLSISAMTLNPGFANSAPLDPPPCPNCHGGGGGGGGGNPGGPGGAPAGGGSQAPQNPPQTHEPASTQPPSTQSEPPATHSSPPAMTSQAPAPQSSEPPATHSSPPAMTSQAPQSSEPGSRGSEPPRSETTQPGEHTTAPSAQPTTPANEHTTQPSKPGITVVLNPPSTQPPHPPYIPRRNDLVTASAQIGGPGGGADITFVVPGRGAPPPPPPRGWGWNDGPAPGHAPPNWVGPPPQGGWDGPPPPGGWNRPWGGPPRDVAVARADFGPFAYNSFTVVPVFNWQFGGWGYWFFGVWVPLY